MTTRLRPWLSAVLILTLSLPTLGCNLFRNMGGTPMENARANAVQALVTTTRAAVLLMTAAGIAYDAGAFGEPGSDRAEDTWEKISAESIRMSTALTAWTEAIKANKDASVHASMVAQALAVIGALLPGKLRASVDGADVPVAAHLEQPGTFRRTPTSYATGGAR